MSEPEDVAEGLSDRFAPVTSFIAALVGERRFRQSAVIAVAGADVLSPPAEAFERRLTGVFFSAIIRRGVAAAVIRGILVWRVLIPRAITVRWFSFGRGLIAVILRGLITW
ncbi:MAG: hypothetical protein GVY18_08370 [Bacteroidetes bacterium]|jgi:hypothetical protein|nr:hypothetical protein [Bacteroidota bacterium]